MYIWLYVVHSTEHCSSLACWMYRVWHQSSSLCHGCITEYFHVIFRVNWSLVWFVKVFLRISEQSKLVHLQPVLTVEQICLCLLNMKMFRKYIIVIDLCLFVYILSLCYSFLFAVYGTRLRFAVELFYNNNNNTNTNNSNNNVICKALYGHNFRGADGRQDWYSSTTRYM